MTDATDPVDAAGDDRPGSDVADSVATEGSRRGPDTADPVTDGSVTDGSLTDGHRRPAPDGGEPQPQPYERRTTVISRTVVRLVVPIILLTAISLLLQGHNLPGGGFIGAVLTATAFVLVYVIFGLEYLQSDLLGLSRDAEGFHALVDDYRWVFALGLALAAGSGIVPILLGFPFLTQGVLFVEGLPVYGELEVASALAFDLGVYFTVVGAILTILGEVGHE